MAIAGGDLSGFGMCRTPSEMLWPRPSAIEPGALSGRTGEKAGCHGGLDTARAVAGCRSLAGMFGCYLAEVGGTAGKERRHQGDDLAGASGFVGWLGKTDRGSRASTPVGGE